MPDTSCPAPLSVDSERERIRNPASADQLAAYLGYFTSLVLPLRWEPLCFHLEKWGQSCPHHKVIVRIKCKALGRLVKESTNFQLGDK